MKPENKTSPANTDAPARNRAVEEPSQGDHWELSLHSSIAEIVMSHFWVSKGEIMGDCRTGKIVRTREGIAFFLHLHTNMSFPEIARMLGRKNHSGLRDASLRFKPHEHGELLDKINGFVRAFWRERRIDKSVKA